MSRGNIEYLDTKQEQLGNSTEQIQPKSNNVKCTFYWWELCIPDHISDREVGIHIGGIVKDISRPNTRFEVTK